MIEHREGGVLARFASPLIVLATIIWGSSFVVMKSSVDMLPTFWLLAIRFSIAAPVLARCPEVPVYTGDRALLASLTGYTLTRGVLCAMARPAPRRAEEISSVLDVALITTPVDYQPPFEVNETFAEVFCAFTGGEPED